MRDTRMARAAALAVVAAAALAGCGKTPGSPPANLAPKTYLFLDIPSSSAADSVHLVPYRQTMHWWGTDRDGSVTGYEWRVVTMTLAGADSAATPWAHTARTDSTFDFPAATPRVRRAFEIRAIDNQGLADPAPIRQELYLKNDPPTVSLKKSLVPGVALPALTVFWSARDPQGVSTLDRYLLWAKGTPEAQAIVVHAPDSSGTLGPSMLAGPDGVRTIYLRAIDRGGMAGALDSVNVTIRALTGDVLVVDDCPPEQSLLIRDFYPTQVDSLLGTGHRTLYRLANDPFGNAGLGALRSASEADSLLSRFRHVVYYREANSVLGSYSQTLRYMQGGLQALLARGGGVYLGGAAIVGSDSSLSCGVTSRPDDKNVFPASGFARDVLGIKSFHAHIVRNAQITYDTNFTLGKNGSAYVPFQPIAGAGTDTLEAGIRAGGRNPSTLFSAETFEPDSAGVAQGKVKVLWQVPAQTLNDQDAVESPTNPYPVAIWSSKRTGKVAYLSYSLALMNFRGNAGQQFRGLLTQLGVTP